MVILPQSLRKRIHANLFIRWTGAGPVGTVKTEFNSITVKGYKAKGIQEEIRKNPALAKKMKMAAMEEELEKGCRDITDML